MRPILILAIILIVLSLILPACKGKSAEPGNEAVTISTSQTNDVSGLPDGNRPDSLDPDTPVSDSDTPEAGTEQPSSTSENPGTEPGDLPEGWRDDISLMPGFTIRTFSSGPGSMLALSEGNVPIEDVTEFYTDIPGWERDSNRDWVTSGTRRLLTYTKDEWKLTVTITRSGEKTTLTIMVVG